MGLFFFEFFCLFVFSFSLMLSLSLSPLSPPKALTSSISRRTRSGSAPGRSILFSTGMISNPASKAK